jgi:uncharacterized protein YlaN (UPF0358 family)
MISPARARVCVCVCLEAHIIGPQRQIKVRIHMYLVDRDDGKNSISNVGKQRQTKITVVCI